MPAGFFAAVLGWSWALWGVTVGFGLDPWGWPGALFLYAGGAGPLLGGLLFAWLSAGRAGLADLVRRLVDPRRIGPVWWLAALGLVPAIGAAAAVLTGTPPGAVLAPLAAHLADPAGFLAAAAFVLLLGPLPEEIGWRGYALDALQARMAPLPASLLLAAGWGAWHAPLFLMEGYHAPFGAAPEPAHFALDLALTTLLITWLHNRTRRSVLAAVLLHFATNFSGEIVAEPPGAAPIATALTALVAAAALAGGGLRRPG
jgi:membrane protease YdiL (CAAX protease family)